MAYLARHKHASHVPCVKYGFIAVLITALTACDKPAKPLQIGNNVWPGYELAYLARDLGYYDDLPVRLVEYSSATQVLGAFQSGLIQSAFLTLDEVLLLRSRGFRARIVLVVDESNGADGVIARAPIMRIDEIKGKRVGVENSAVGAFLLLKALEQSKLSLRDVRIVPMEVDLHERAYREGRVDVLVTFEPVLSRLRAQGANLLFDSSQMSGKIIDVLAVDEGAWQEHRDTLIKVLQGWSRATHYLQTYPDDAVRRIARRLRLNPDAIKNNYAGIRLLSIDDNLTMLTGAPSKLDQVAAEYWPFMEEYKLLGSVVSMKAGLADLVDPTIVNAIEAATLK